MLRVLRARVHVALFLRGLRTGGRQVRTVMAMGSVFCEPMMTSDFLMPSGQRSRYVAQA